MGLPTIIEVTNKDSRREQEDSDLRIDLYGSGYRSALFHTGAFWRLEELGLLARVKMIACSPALGFFSAILLKQASGVWMHPGCSDRAPQGYTPAACGGVFRAIRNTKIKSLKETGTASSADVGVNSPTELTLYWGAHWTGLLDSEHISQVKLETDLSDVLQCQAFNSGDTLCSKLLQIPDDFKPLDRITQEYLVDWGYAVCEASLPNGVRQNQRLPFGSPNRLLYFKIARKPEIQVPADPSGVTTRQKNQTQEAIPHMSLPGAA